MFYKMAATVFDRHNDKSWRSACLSAGWVLVSNTINSCPGANKKREKQTETHTHTHTTYSISQSAGVWQSLQSAKAHTLTPSDPPNNFSTDISECITQQSNTLGQTQGEAQVFHPGFAACCCADRSGLPGIHSG